MKNTPDQGFTLLEVLAALAIIGVLSAISAPLILWANKPLQNATYQTSGILTQGRSRAIATTSSLRIRPDPASPNTTLKIEASDTRSCDAGVTALTASHATSSTQINVVSTQGFAAGDQLKIGSDETNNVVLTTDSENSVLTLGESLGSTQADGSSVEIVENWNTDNSFFDSDRTLPSEVAMTSNLTDWVLCFDSRGIATISDASGVTTEDLEIILKSSQSIEEGKILVFQGGMIDSVVIKPEVSIEEEIVVAASEETESSGIDETTSETSDEESTTEDKTGTSTDEESDTEEEISDLPEDILEKITVLEEGVLVTEETSTKDEEITEKASTDDEESTEVDPNSPTGLLTSIEEMINARELTDSKREEWEKWLASSLVKAQSGNLTPVEEAAWRIRLMIVLKYA